MPAALQSKFVQHGELTVEKLRKRLDTTPESIDIIGVIQPFGTRHDTQHVFYSSESGLKKCHWRLTMMLITTILEGLSARVCGNINNSVRNVVVARPRATDITTVCNQKLLLSASGTSLGCLDDAKLS